MVPAQKNSLIYNFSSLGIIQVANFLLSLVVIPFVIKNVGADGFGVVAVAQVLIFYLAVITDYGFNRTATRDIALYHEDSEKVSKVFVNVMAAKFILCITCFFLLLTLAFIVSLFRAHFMLYMLAFSFVLGQALLINWFFQGFEKMHFIAIGALISRLIFAALVFIFIRHKGDNIYYLFFMGIGNIVAGIVSIFVAIRMYKLRIVRPTWSDVRKEFSEGWHITVTNLSMTTTQYIGIFILRIFTNDLLVGYYSIAEKIYFAMKMMLDIFTQVAYPRVCRLVLSGKASLIAFFRRTYIPFLLLVIGGTSMIFLLSSPITRFFIGQGNSYSSFLLRILCVATVIVCLNMPAQLILLAADHKRSYLKIFTMGTALNILANLILAKYFDATGTVIAVLVTESFITAGLYLELRRIYRASALNQAPG